MRLGIICGSHRNDSQSYKVAQYTAKVYQRLFSNHTIYMLNLANNPLPLWDESFWEDDPKWTTLWQPIASELQTCDGFVVVAPEWNGMVPAGLKNFFLFAGARELGHKPALIVALSAARGGAYPVSELRISSYKNSRLCYIPEHVIVRNVEEMFLGDQPANDDDRYIRQRLEYALKVLERYAAGLKLVRESGVVDHKTYPNGMS